MVPGTITSIIQPLDVSVNTPFMGTFRKPYTQWLCDDHTYTVSGKLKIPLISIVLEWFINAWKAVKCETFIKSFKKCGNSNKLDGTVDSTCLLYTSRCV